MLFGCRLCLHTRPSNIHWKFNREAGMEQMMPRGTNLLEMNAQMYNKRGGVNHGKAKHLIWAAEHYSKIMFARFGCGANFVCADDEINCNPIRNQVNMQDKSIQNPWSKKGCKHIEN